jgi:hypothetical protein
MIGFHIDMHMAHYRADYLSDWLVRLAQRGYDTVLWEVENNVAWETCPECIAPDAMTRGEFAAVLAQCRALGMEAVPLFQTFAHAEYVLQHEKYAGFREVQARVDQYCPLNEQVVPFLHQWIDEYLDLFGDVQRFHLGADEARALGACPRCEQFVGQSSLSNLYVQHINAVIEPLIARGVRPAIWADMVLQHGEALDELSRNVTLFDWMYETYRGSGHVWVWGEGMRTRAELRPELKERFGPYLFPEGDEPGREPEVFYSSDFLADQGFEVVICPSSSSYRDNVFTPRHWLHVANTFDSFRKGRSPHLAGSVLTSWSVRLHPWILQLSAIDIPEYIGMDDCASLDAYRDWYARREFGASDDGLWRSCGMLSKSCLFSESATLGYGTACLPAPEGIVRTTLVKLREEGRLEDEMVNCEARLAQYVSAQEGIARFSRIATEGQSTLAVWDLAARNLIARAAASAFMLKWSDNVMGGMALDGAPRTRALELLGETAALRSETMRLYLTMIGPSRVHLMMGYMYDAVQEALAGLAGVAGPPAVAA